MCMQFSFDFFLKVSCQQKHLSFVSTKTFAFNFVSGKTFCVLLLSDTSTAQRGKVDMLRFNSKNLKVLHMKEAIKY